MRIVIDTNVMVASLKSRRGASFKLISSLPNENFSTVLSVPLMIEYEAVLKKNKWEANITLDDIDNFLDYSCSISEHQKIFFLWRPLLPDPFDDHLLEVAVASECEAIITYNKRDFKGIEKFGLKLLDPREALIKTGHI